MTERKLPMPVWIMLGMVATVLLAGYLVFPRTDSEREELMSRLGTTNKGVLLKPVVDVTGLGWRDATGLTWRLADRERKWRLVVPEGADCGEPCRKMLFLARQVHIRLGKNAERVERIYLNLDEGLSPETANYLQTEHPGLKVLSGDRAQWSQSLSRTNADWRPGASRLFVVDPNGLAMMYYTNQHGGNEMLSDLNRLLKYSAR